MPGSTAGITARPGTSGSPAVTALQLVAPGTGFAWTLGWKGRPEDPPPTSGALPDHRRGRNWEHGRLTLRPTPSAPLLTFHRRRRRLASDRQSHLAHQRWRPDLAPRLIVL